MKHKCNGSCIYFPAMDSEVTYYYDKNGVKRKTNSQKYICSYTDEDINFKKKCKHYKTYNDVKGSVYIE